MTATTPCRGRRQNRRPPAPELTTLTQHMLPATWHGSVGRPIYTLCFSYHYSHVTLTFLVHSNKTPFLPHHSPSYGPVFFPYKSYQQNPKQKNKTKNKNRNNTKIPNTKQTTTTTTPPLPSLPSRPMMTTQIMITLPIMSTLRCRRRICWWCRWQHDRGYRYNKKSTKYVLC